VYDGVRAPFERVSTLDDERRNDAEEEKKRLRESVAAYKASHNIYVLRSRT